MIDPRTEYPLLLADLLVGERFEMFRYDGEFQRVSLPEKLDKGSKYNLAVVNLKKGEVYFAPHDKHVRVIEKDTEEVNEIIRKEETILADMGYAAAELYIRAGLKDTRVTMFEYQKSVWRVEKLLGRELTDADRGVVSKSYNDTLRARTKPYVAQ